MEKLGAILIVDDDADVRQAARLALTLACRTMDATSLAACRKRWSPAFSTACCWT